MARNILDVFKYLDKNGLRKLISLIKRGLQEHWIGTMAEYEAQKANIPAGTIVALTDDEDTVYDHGKYALVETVTGKRWIDGKPIYRKVFNVTNTLTVAGTLYIATGVADGIDRVVNLYGTSTARSTALNAGVQRILPFGYYGNGTVDDQWACNITYRAGNNDFILQEGANISAESASYTFTVEYTKTVD